MRATPFRITVKSTEKNILGDSVSILLTAHELIYITVTLYGLRDNREYGPKYIYNIYKVYIILRIYIYK